MANTENKITKAMVLDMILEACADNEDIVAYCENEKALLENKKVKARERQDKKRAEGDELQAAVASVLTAEPQTRDEIFAQIEGDDLTVGKIQSKLNNLVKFNQASKTTVKVEGEDGKAKSKVAYTTFVADVE